MQSAPEFVAEGIVYEAMALDRRTAPKCLGNHHDLEVGLRAGRNAVRATFVLYVKYGRGERAT
jgi:hypothetical protein